MIRSCTKFRNILLSASTNTTQADTTSSSVQITTWINLSGYRRYTSYELFWEEAWPQWSLTHDKFRLGVQIWNTSNLPTRGLPTCLAPKFSYATRYYKLPCQETYAGIRRCWVTRTDRWYRSTMEYRPLIPEAGTTISSMMLSYMIYHIIYKILAL